MKAKRKPLKETSLSELGVDYSPFVLVKALEEPPTKAAGQIVPDVSTLIDKLQNEAKAL
jgi:electron transfer flavoprotein beta subunit